MTKTFVRDRLRHGDFHKLPTDPPGAFRMRIERMSRDLERIRKSGSYGKGAGSIARAVEAGHVRLSHWRRLSLAYGVDPNVDGLPPFIGDALPPCPECGAVWVEALGIIFVMPLAGYGETVGTGNNMWIRPHASPAFPCGARLLCASGHMIDVDTEAQKTRTVRPPPEFGSDAMMGALGYLMAQDCWEDV